MRSNTSAGRLRVHVLPFRIGIDGEDAQSVCHRQQSKRDDFRPLSGGARSFAPSKRPTERGVRFQFLPEEFGEVLPTERSLNRPAAEFHPQRNEILETPLIREPLPDRGDPLDGSDTCWRMSSRAFGRRRSMTARNTCSLSSKFE